MSTRSVSSILTIAWKTVVRKLFRNVVLVLAVSLLVSLLVFALLFNNAVQTDLEEANKRLGADIVIVPQEAKTVAEEFILESKIKTFYMDEFVFDSVADLPEIKQATYHVYLNTLGSGCCSIDEGQVIAFDQGSDFVIRPWLETGPEHLNNTEIYVGSYIYEFLGLINTATLFGQGVKVVGHLKETGTGIDRGVFMRLDDLAKVSPAAMGDYKPGKISIIFLKVKEGIDPEMVVAKIRTINPRLGIMTRGNIGAGVRTTLKDIVRIFSITIFIASLLAVLLAWSTFTALANERRREVGILRAIGATRAHIMKIFLSEALIISTIGGLIGTALGHYLIHYLSRDFVLLARLSKVAAFGGDTVLISLIAVAAGIAVCLLGAAMPVSRLANLEPLLAIKEE
ncbi:ABC transporter permease [Thiovibrio sp. JS02]